MPSNKPFTTKLPAVDQSAIRAMEKAKAAERHELTDYEANRLLKLIHTRIERRYESLRLYEPLPSQLGFHSSAAKERLAVGSNRSGKAQPVDEPVLTPNGWTEIGKLKIGDVVIGGDGFPCRVTGVFPQGEKQVFRVEFGDGSTTRCCEDHLWKVQTGKERFDKKTGEWSVLSLGDIRSQCGDEPAAYNRPIVPTCVPWMPRRTTSIDPYVVGLFLGDGSLSTRSPSISTADEEIAVAVQNELPGGLKLQRQSRHNGKVSYDYRISHGKPSHRNEFTESLRTLGMLGVRAWEKRVPSDYLFNTAEVRLAVLQGLMDTDGTISLPYPNNRQGRSVSFTTTSEHLAKDVCYLVRSLGGRCSVSEWVRKSFNYRGTKRLGRPCARLHISMFEHCPFRLARKASEWNEWKEKATKRPAKILRKISEDGTAECVCIAVDSPDHTYVTRDLIVTHNTTAACAEIAFAATGQHPWRKYPEGPLEIYLVAKDGRQIGEVWWHKLTQNAFYMIRDLQTKMWRAYRPHDPSDLERADEKKVAPPLIPERFWDGEPAWEDKRLGIPKLLKLKNGTRIHFFTGNGKPPHGTAIHLAAFSEELGSELWYPEIAVRLAQHNGDFIWDATPQAGGEGLYELYLRSEKEIGKENPRVTYHFMHIEANPHISKEARENLLAKLTDPEQHAVRWEGRFPGSQLHIFPEWSERTHVGTLAKEGWVSGPDCNEPHMPIPKDWTRYMVVDPGHTTCAVLFAAVPPPKAFGDYIYVYDELYIQPCMNADHFATSVQSKIQDDVFREFIIDSHGSRRTEEGSGFTIAQQYSKALARLKIRSQITGSSFIDGMDEVKAGNMAVHDWLHVRGATGDTKLRVLRGCCPNFVSEMKRYRKKRTPQGEILDEPYGKHDHLVSCIRYLRGRNPKYHKPPPAKSLKKLDGMDVWKAFQERDRKRYGAEYVNLGPGAGQSYTARFSK